MIEKMHSKKSDKPYGYHPINLWLLDEVWKGHVMHIENK